MEAYSTLVLPNFDTLIELTPFLAFQDQTNLIKEIDMK